MADKTFEIDKMPERTLTFSDKRQDAFLGHLLINDVFFRQCVELVQPEWFIALPSGKVWAAKVRFWREFNRGPLSLVELQEAIGFTGEDGQTYARMKAKVIEAVSMTASYGLDSLIPELKQWLHCRYFVEGVGEAVLLYNRGQFEPAYEMMDKALRKQKTNGFDRARPVKWSDYDAWAERTAIDVDTALTFGSPEVDRLLLPSANPEGRRDTVGLLRGEQTLLISPLNIGKTTTMLNIAVHNAVRRGKSVLWMTHEGREDDIRQKGYCSSFAVNPNELVTYRDSQQGALDWKECTEAMDENLHYVHYARAGLTVEEVGNAVRRLSDERAALHQGRGYDLVINDYLAKLISGNPILAGAFQHRNLLGYVYNYFVQLADEYKFHHVTAQQTNRTGSKINKGMLNANSKLEERILTPEDANESLEPAQTAANVITINRDQYCQALGYTAYAGCKSRQSKTGWVVVCKGDWAKAITHSDSDTLGAYWYHGNVPPGHRVEKLYTEWKGKEVLDITGLHDGNPE